MTPWIASGVALVAMFGFGCVDTRSVTIDLYEPFGEAGLRSGLQCSCTDYAPAERQLLIANATDVAVVLEAMTWSTKGLPSCRGPDLQPHCDEVECAVESASPRSCIDVTLEDGGEPSETLAFRSNTIHEAVRGLALPDVLSEPAGIVRMVVVAGTCADLEFDASGRYSPSDPSRRPTYPLDRLVACASSCPTLFASPDDPVRLGLILGECDEANLRQCAANPLSFGEPPARGECRL